LIVPRGNSAVGDVTEPRAGSRRPVRGGGPGPRIGPRREREVIQPMCTPTVICEVVTS